MAGERDQEAAGGRLVLLIALAGLAAATAAAFGRVFKGQGPTFLLMLAGVASVLLAGALERRHVILATAVSALGLAFAIGLIVFPETTKFGFPTLGTWRAVTVSLNEVGRTADTQVAPTLPLKPLMLAAVTALWSASFAAHALAARARSPFLALVPPVALVAFTNMVMEDGARPAYVVLFLAAAVAVLFGDGLRRVGQWGPVTMWHGRRHLRFGSTTNTRGARTVGVACLMVAAVLPWVLPGFHAKSLLDVGDANSAQHVSIDPLVDIRPTLIDNPNVQLFTVQTSGDRGSYWRTLTLDTFNGRFWTSSNLEAAGGTALGSGPVGYQAGPGSGAATVGLQQHVVIDRLGQLYLPVAPDATYVSVPRGNARYDGTTSTLVAPSASFPGFSYDVASQQTVPTPQLLDQVTSVYSAQYRFYTALPRATPAQIYSIAHQLTDHEPTIYQKILAIQEHLQQFRYDLHVPPGDGTNDVLNFLTKTKAGYCQQFAGTMAVLLRAIGIPARVAMGFTPGRFDPRDHRWHITGSNAHAWVEVQFPQFGWLGFEPTPGRSNPVTRTYSQPSFGAIPAAGANQCPGGLVNGRCVETGLAPGKKNHFVGTGTHKDPHGFELPQDRGDVPFRTAGSPILAVGQAPDHRERWIRAGVVALGVTVVLLLIGMPLSKRLRRRWLLGRAHSAHDRVLAAYMAMQAEAADLGLGRRPAETIEEYRTRLRSKVASLDGDLDRVTVSVGRAAYAEDGLSPDQADQAVASARRVAHDIRRAADLRTRMLSWYRPGRGFPFGR